MSKFIYCFVGQWTKVFTYKSSKETIRQLRKMNKDLGRGPEIDAVNLSSDFNRVYESLDKSFSKLQKESAL